MYFSENISFILTKKGLGNFQLYNKQKMDWEQYLAIGFGDVLVKSGGVLTCILL